MKSPFILRCVLALLLLIVTFSNGVSQLSDCKEIKAKILITDATPGNSDGKIEVVVERGPDQVSINLLAVGQDPRYNLSSLSIDNLPKGKYLVVVGDKKKKSDYCPKAIHASIN